FDGASSGNPGPAGAGAVLLSENGTVLYRFREGLGYQTNNVAEYRALILGLKQAIRKGCMYEHHYPGRLPACYQPGWFC
ncbi:ribonuclease HI-like protein, partial [Trifolium pratense]